MAEVFDPKKEGRRITAAYLEGISLARQWRRIINDAVYGAFDAEKREERWRQADQKEAAAETLLSSDFERWRKDPSPEAKEVLATMLEILGKRHDLGFIGNRVVGHLRRGLRPF